MTPTPDSKAVGFTRLSPRCWWWCFHPTRGLLPMAMYSIERLETGRVERSRNAAYQPLPPSANLNSPFFP